MSDPNRNKVIANTNETPDVLQTIKTRAVDAVAGAADAAIAARDRAAELASSTREKMHQAAEATEHLAFQAKDKMQEWSTAAADRAVDAAQDAGRELTTLVRRYPIQSVLVGFAIGYLLARATNRS
jgi:ElaB/YqjD/DUF883 family membrane-anchored ribosome-binding protein